MIHHGAAKPQPNEKTDHVYVHDRLHTEQESWAYIVDEELKRGDD